jgi:hypothetical protein
MTTTDRTNDPTERQARLLIRRYEGTPFAIRGFVDGREVAAETVDESIVVDEVLYHRACGLVEQGATFELPDYDVAFEACVDGDDVAVALTFLRSFDRIVSMRMSLDIR